MASTRSGSALSKNMVERKVKRIQTLKLDDPELVRAFDVVGEFWTENTPEARRKLRSELERRQVDKAERFLSQFRPVKEALQSVERRAQQLEAQVSGLATEVRDSDESCRSMVAEYEALVERLEEARAARQAVESFMSRYQLTSAEVLALESADFDGSLSEFLGALKKVRLAREMCAKAIESGEDVLNKYSTVSALSLMETLAAQHETAFARLFEWALRLLDSEEAAAFIEDAATAERSSLRDAIGELCVRDAYARDVCEAVVRCRGEAMRKRFEDYMRLQQSGSSRYVSDACAWCHQTIASEQEVAMSLFPPDGAEVAAQAAQSLAAPLGSRLDQAVLAAKDDAVQLHKMAQVVDFYREVLADAARDDVRDELSLSARLVRCAETTREACVNRVDRAATTITEMKLADFVKVSPVASNGLSDDAYYTRRDEYESVVSDAVRSSVHLATQLLLADVDALNSIASSAAPLARRVLDPLAHKLRACLALCSRIFSGAEDFVGRQREHTSRPPSRRQLGAAANWSNSDACVFVINAAAFAASKIVSPLLDTASQSLVDEATGLASSFNDLADTALHALASHQAAEMLRQCRLTAALDYARRASLLDGDLDSLGGPASESVPQADLAAALRAFYSSLFSSAAPELNTIIDLNHRSFARKAIAKRFAKAHETIHALARHPTLGGYSDTSFLVHTPRQVSVLLDCDDDDEDESQRQPND